VADLQRRERVLEEAFIFERRIDGATYESHRDQLREEIARARIGLEDWMEASPDQRVRLQSVLFPEGLRLKDGQLGTAVTCLAFAQLPANAADESGLASPSAHTAVGPAIGGLLVAS